MKQSRRTVEMQEACAQMGLALALLHEIEHDLARAFFVGMTEKQKKKYKTMDDLVAARRRMTFGQLVGLMKEQWELTPELDEFLDFFVEERNHLVHDLTETPGFGLMKKRDRERLMKRVAIFLQAAFLARRVFRGAHHASLDFAADWLKTHREIDIELPTTPEIEQRIDEFLDAIGTLRTVPGEVGP